MPPYRVRQGDTLILSYRASAAPAMLEGWIDVQYDDGSFDFFSAKAVSFTTDRTTVSVRANGSCKRDGHVVNATIGQTAGATPLKRGQMYAFLTMDREGYADVTLCKGYSYHNGNINLGEFVEPGPGSGHGFFTIGALKADTAPAASTAFGAATNTIRKVYGFIWYYNCAAVVATRTMTVKLNKHFGTSPTGFAGAGTVWASAAVSLTTGEEGTVYLMALEANGGFLSFNDNATLTYANSTTAPHPFPILLLEDASTTALSFDVGSGDSGDRDSIYVLYEEWILI